MLFHPGVHADFACHYQQVEVAQVFQHLGALGLGRVGGQDRLDMDGGELTGYFCGGETIVFQFFQVVGPEPVDFGERFPVFRLTAVLHSAVDFHDVQQLEAHGVELEMFAGKFLACCFRKC